MEFELTALVPKHSQALEERMAWSDEDTCRAMGMLLDDLEERLEKIRRDRLAKPADRREEDEVLYWVFVAGKRAIVPFDLCCRAFGIDPKRVRGELLEVEVIRRKVERVKRLKERFALECA